MPLLRDKPKLWPDSVVRGQAVHHCCWRHSCVWECDGGGGHRAWSTAHQHDPARAALWGEWRPARTPLPERGAAGHDGESGEGACCAAGFCWVRSKPPVWVRIGMQERGRVCCCRKHAGSVFFPHSSFFSLTDASNSSALRCLEVFQGCFFNMFQPELPVQAASLPAPCMFYLILNASLGYICVVMLVAWLGVILHCRETPLGCCVKSLCSIFADASDECLQASKAWCKYKSAFIWAQRTGV